MIVWHCSFNCLKSTKIAIILRSEFSSDYNFNDDKFLFVLFSQTPQCMTLRVAAGWVGKHIVFRFGFHYDLWYISKLLCNYLLSPISTDDIRSVLKIYVLYFATGFDGGMCLTVNLGWMTCLYYMVTKCFHKNCILEVSGM